MRYKYPVADKLLHKSRRNVLEFVKEKLRTEYMTCWLSCSAYITTLWNNVSGAMLTCTTLPNNRQRAHAAKGYRDREKLGDGTSAESDAHLNFPRDFFNIPNVCSKCQKESKTDREREQSQEKDDKEEIEGCGEVILHIEGKVCVRNCLVNAPSAAPGKRNKGQTKLPEKEKKHPFANSIQITVPFKSLGIRVKISFCAFFIFPAN